MIVVLQAGSEKELQGGAGGGGGGIRLGLAF